MATNYTPDQLALFQAQIDAMDKVIAGGAAMIDYPERVRIQYRSLADLQTIRNDLQAKINSASSANPQPVRTRRVVIIGNSGW